MAPRMHWHYEELPWDTLDHSKIDPDLVPLIKAAALVEFNADDYTAHLVKVFHDDEEFKQAAFDWAVEEVQHGRALGRWAELVDPTFKFDEAVKRFREGYQIPVQEGVSARGSRTGEMIARCMVETGTSSYYAAIGESTDEPVLKLICKNIAADELRHFKLFYTYTRKYLDVEQLNRLQRLRVALSRIGESEDDELAYAYYAANTPAGVPYDHATYNLAYKRGAYSRFRRHHINRALAMIFKACGLKPYTTLYNVASSGVWWMLANQNRKLAKAAAVA